MNYRFLLLLIFSFLLNNHAQSSESFVTIESYQPDRDRDAVLKIINDYPHYLAYESLGLPEGTTEKYLTNPQYITWVLRYDGKTIGFINFGSWDYHLLTFYLGRIGLIHLLGIDAAYQKKGLGKLLLEYAMTDLKNKQTPKIIVSTRTDNTIARTLYEKTGFTCLSAINEKTPEQPLAYLMKTNVPTDSLPKGNIIQRHPKEFLAGLALIAGGTILYKYTS